jgi:hypothetical protein
MTAKILKIYTSNQSEQLNIKKFLEKEEKEEEEFYSFINFIIDNKLPIKLNFIEYNIGIPKYIELIKNINKNIENKDNGNVKNCFDIFAADYINNNVHIYAKKGNITFFLPGNKNIQCLSREELNTLSSNYTHLEYEDDIYRRRIPYIQLHTEQGAVYMHYNYLCEILISQINIFFLSIVSDKKIKGKPIVIVNSLKMIKKIS